MSEFWDKIYNKDEYIYWEKPNKLSENIRQNKE